MQENKENMQISKYLVRPFGTQQTPVKSSLIA